MRPTQRLKIVSQVLPVVLIFGILPATLAQKHIKQKPPKQGKSDPPAIIWRDPGNISALNLVYGAGGREHAPDPNGRYIFENEDMNGTSPKFYVKDSNGVRWQIKLGAETKSETAATRLLWAAGYFVDEDYYLAEVKVEGLPELRRGQRFVTNGDLVSGARLKRRNKKIKKIGHWDWFKNPFGGTRELNGLRVMMALVNNWDLKEVNNRVYIVDGEQRYVVSDLGATFGKTGNSISRSKSDPEGFVRTKFIDKVTDEEADFEMRSRPFFATVVNVPNYKQRTKMQEITKNIPRADARWLGHLLGQLTEQQIRDCFRTAGYASEEITGYASEVQKRIAELNAL
jgi:hypothetical protein